MTDDQSKNVPLGKREFQPNPSTYIAESLVEHGVTFVFGIHGGHVWQIVDEISNAGIKFITFRHEQAAAYAAEAYSKVTLKPGVCVATAGPGVGNAFSAIQQANMSCFYFEAFDEPWKSSTVDGSESHFGLFTVDGKAKAVIWHLVDEGVFDGLGRNGKPVTKTFDGKREALMETVKAPVIFKFQP